jgi:hypothetical protein
VEDSFMNHLPTGCRIDLPDLREGTGLSTRVRRLLANSELPGPGGDGGPPHWDASFFGLDGSSLFRELGDDAQRELLAACSRSLLEESYFIERAGMSFAPKMALLAESAEEQTLYCLFSAQEACHHSMIAAWVNPLGTRPLEDPFLALLAQSINACSRRQLIFLVQVVLEGWGLHHYHGLESGCRTPRLREVFRRILRDEAHHHGSGVELFREGQLSSQELSGLVELIADLLSMVRSGPVGVASLLEASAGGLTPGQRGRTLKELGHPGRAQEKLKRLRSLMETAGARRILEALDGVQAFACRSLEGATF